MSEQLTIMCVTYSILAACLESDAYVTCICMAYLITFTQILDGTISFHPFITQFAWHRINIDAYIHYTRLHISTHYVKHAMTMFTEIKTKNPCNQFSWSLRRWNEIEMKFDTLEKKWNRFIYIDILFCLRLRGIYCLRWEPNANEGEQSIFACDLADFVVVSKTIHWIVWSVSKYAHTDKYHFPYSCVVGSHSLNSFRSCISQR